MNSDNKKVTIARIGQDDVSIDTARKPYQKPVLTCYGDVRDVTLGPTFGGGESGCEGIFKVGPGGCPSP